MWCHGAPGLGDSRVQGALPRVLLLCAGGRTCVERGQGLERERRQTSALREEKLEAQKVSALPACHGGEGGHVPPTARG